MFSSCGFGESTTDVVFAGNGLIYENGTLLASSERFSFGEQVVISEIDVEHIRLQLVTLIARRKCRYVSLRNMSTPEI